MTDYRVTLWTTEGEAAEILVEDVRDHSRDTAIDAALEELADGDLDVHPDLRDLEGDDVVDAKAVPLCDLCKAAMHERVEAEGFVVVTDPSDVMDLPLGEEPPEREVSICAEHLRAVKSVSPSETATDGGRDE